MQTANCLGLPLQANTVIILDTPGLDGLSHQNLIDALLAEAQRDPAPQVAVVFGNTKEQTWPTDGFTPLNRGIDVLVDSLNSELLEHQSQQAPKAASALKIALDRNPSRVIWVKTGIPDFDTLMSLSDTLEQNTSTPIDCIWIGSEMPRAIEALFNTAHHRVFHLRSLSTIDDASSPTG